METARDQTADLQRFIDRAKQVTQLTELTPEIVHEFVEKIIVHKPEKIDGKRYQQVDMLLNDREATERTTTLENSLESHFMALAAEESRLHGGRVIDLEEFKKQ